MHLFNSQCFPLCTKAVQEYADGLGGLGDLKNDLGEMLDCFYLIGVFKAFTKKEDDRGER